MATGATQSDTKNRNVETPDMKASDIYQQNSATNSHWF